MAKSGSRRLVSGKVYKAGAIRLGSARLGRSVANTKDSAVAGPAIVISAFSEDHVERLTGLSRAQLRYWDRTGFFSPAFAAENRRVAYSRIYSFRDIAALRVLNVLRNQYCVPLQHLRKVADELSHLADERWTATSLYVLNRKVVFAEPRTRRLREILSKQYVVPLALKTVVDDTRDAVRKLSEREATEIGKVEQRRNVNHNAAVLAGTRIPVRAIQNFVEDGFTVEQILLEYPSLTKADVEAAKRHRPTLKAA